MLPFFQVDRTALFVICVFLFVCVGGWYVQNAYSKQKISFPKNLSLDTDIKLSSQTVALTEDIYDPQKVHTVDLVITLKNNTSGNLNFLELWIPNIGLGTIETSSAKRYQFLTRKQSEDVFSLGFLPQGKEKTFIVKFYATTAGEYKVRINVETLEKIRGISNVVILVVQ